MKIQINKIETYTITHTTPKFIFEMDEFRNCTPAFIGNSEREFMDYLTNDIEVIKEFLKDNDEILESETKKYLYLLEVDPVFEIIEDSRESYEDSWFEMKPEIEIEKKKTSNIKSEKVID
tara:strand:+ start:3576 stop:3935 length:360 start_codon:yes stop_codon:yes gene_type:complete